MALQLSFCLEEFTCSGCLDLKGMQHSIWWIKSDNEKDLGQFGSHCRKRVHTFLQYILILLFNLFPKNILFQALVLEMKPASKNATSLLSGNTLLDAITKKMLCFLATVTKIQDSKDSNNQKKTRPKVLERTARWSFLTMSMSNCPIGHHVTQENHIWYPLTPCLSKYI